VVVLVALWALVEVVAIRLALDDARSDLLDLDLVELAGEPGGIDGLVDASVDRIDAAHRRASRSPVLGVLSHVPVVSGQIGGLRTITGALAGIGTEARVAGSAIQDRFDRLDEGGAARVALLEEVLAQLLRLETAVRDADLGAGSLPGPLGWARDDLAEQLDRAVERLTDAEELVRTSHRLLVGPSRYLLLAGNNSEMRATPMPLSAGILELRDGEIEVSEFVQTGDLLLPEDLAVEPPADLAALYDGLWGLGREWRTSTTTPRFPVAAELMARMSAQIFMGEVDGVLLIDAITLGAMVDAVGGIEVEGEVQSGDDIVEEVLNLNYLELGEGGPVRRQRVELQGELARTAFDQLTAASDAVLELVAQIPRLADGRHLLAWSSAPDVQSLWEELGADGEIGTHPFMIAVQNASGGKRDWYLDPEVTVHTGSSLSGRTTRVLATLRLHNPVIEPSTEFIDGTSRFIEPGEYRSFVTVYLPQSATDVSIRGGAELRSLGRDGPAVVTTSWFRVKPGETRSFTVEFEVPSSDNAALVIPSARVRPVRYVVDGTEVLDDAPTPVFWLAGPAGDSDAERTAWALGAGAAIAGYVAVAWALRRRLGIEGAGAPAAQASVTAPRSAPEASRAYLASTPDV
jgi:hypothetical protein